MPVVDPRMSRVAARLSSLQLLAEPDDADWHSPHFVHTYSEAGLRAAFAAYGVDKLLAERGLAEPELRITIDDPFHHQLELFTRVDGERVPIMDLRVHLSRVHFPTPHPLLDALLPEAIADVVIIDWLTMQNPKARFSAERPRLPGQQYPGTGLGRVAHNLLVLLCQRVAREALVIVPERFHLAELYRRAGYLAVQPRDEEEIDHVLAATSHLPFAQRAWAVERGFVRHSSDGAVYRYRPHDRVFPVTARLARLLAPASVLSLGSVFARRLLFERRFVVDDDGLRASLLADPVDGLHLDDVTRAAPADGHGEHGEHSEHGEPTSARSEGGDGAVEHGRPR